MKKISLTISFCVPGMDFSGDSLGKHSLGGSETSALCLSRELAKRGHNVTVYSNCNKPTTGDPGVYDNVLYHHINIFNDYAINCPVDVMVIQRNASLFCKEFQSKLNILWNHDLAVKRGRGTIQGVLWNIDYITGLSKFHIEQQKEVHSLPDSIMWQTRNGVDIKDLTFDLNIKDPKKLMFCSRPERGLENLVKSGGIMEQLYKIDPELKLYVAGYDHTTDQMRNYYNYLWDLVEKSPNCVNLGPLPKYKLYKHYSEAWAYLYNTDFEEISCITSLEATGSGMVFIGPATAALPETVGDCGILLNEPTQTKEFDDRFVKEILGLTSDSHSEIALRGRKRVEQSDWSIIAEEWESKFISFFKEQTKDKNRLAQHFLYHGDKTIYSSLNTKEKIEMIPQEYIVPIPTTIEEAKELAYPATIEYLKNKIKQDTINIVVYGSDYGQYVFALAEFFPKAIITGIELDYRKRKIAGDLNDNSNIVFTDNLNAVCWAKTLVIIESIEKVIEPGIFVNDLEKRLPENAQVFIVVKSGPENPPEKKWNLERQDLKEMFIKKKNFSLTFSPFGHYSSGGMVLYWLIGYTKSDASTKSIDLERKCLIQRPRNTMSLCMIAKNSESMLHRALKSARLLVDEIVIADTGSTDSTKSIIKSYEKYMPVTLIDGKDPLIYGFETPRNEALQKCKGDWILWIDSDEELLMSQNLPKYLKTRIYNGYAIRQHHFSCVPPNCFKPDTPVRVFRNNGKIEWRGCLSGDTLVDMPRDLKVYPNGIPIKKLVGNKNFGIYSWDNENKQLVLDKVERVWKTKTNTEVYELEYEWYTRDKNRKIVKYKSKLIATPEHRMLMRDGSYRELQDLKLNDSLMPFNRRFDCDGYACIAVASVWFAKEHRFLLGLTTGGGQVGHHKDRNKLNNNIENLSACNNHREHSEIHVPERSKATKNFFKNKEKAAARNKNVSLKLKESYANGNSKWKKAWLRKNNPSFRDDVKIKHKYSAYIQFRNFVKAGEILKLHPWLSGMKVFTMSEETVQKRNKQLSYTSSVLSQGNANPNARNYDSALRKELRESLHISDNHKVITVKKLNEKIDVYDIETEKHHNFVANGVFVHNSIHEHAETGINESVGLSACMSDVEIAHDGYLTEEIRRGRFDRNFNLLMKDREKYPERKLGKFLMMRDWMHLARYELESNGNIISPLVTDYCNKIIEVYEKDFIDVPDHMQEDGLEYYATALGWLGKGVEIRWALDINISNTNPAVMTKVSRFSNKEQFQRYLESRIRIQAEPYEGPYV